MKRKFLLVLLCLFLTGCSNHSDLHKTMEFREQLLKSDGCTFQANITAEYGDVLYTFSLDCTFDRNGSMTFEVLSPTSISGITGTVSKEQGALTFDDKALLFELMADEQLTPISAPWHVMNAMRSGYIQSCGADGENIKIIIDDNYASNALRIDLLVTQDMTPLAADISWKNRRILAIEIVSFSYM